MRESAIGILKQHFDFKIMEEDADTWRFIENDMGTCVPVNYAYDMVMYQNAYFSNVHEELTDISLVIYNGGKACGIWPLCVYKNQDGYQIGSWGGYYYLHCCAKMAIQWNRRGNS